MTALTSSTLLHMLAPAQVRPPTALPCTRRPPRCLTPHTPLTAWPLKHNGAVLCYVLLLVSACVACAHRLPPAQVTVSVRTCLVGDCLSPMCDHCLACDSGL